MQNRMQVLQNLIELRLKADANNKLDAVYQFMLRDARPTESDIDYIDQQVNMRRAEAKTGAPPPGPRVGPGKLPSTAVSEAFRRATPLARIYPCIHKIGSGWSNDARVVEKAYVMACLSEAAYLHLAKHEVQGHDRYKIFPSTLLRELMRRQWRSLLLVEPPLRHGAAFPFP